MKIDGWAIRDDGVFPPMPAGTPPAEQVPTVKMVPVATLAVSEGKLAEKRKHEEDDWEIDIGEEPATKKQA